MPPAPRLSVALAALALVAVFGACGGKSDKERLADDVNEICRDLKGSLEQLQSANSLEEIGRQGKRLIPEVDRAGKRLANVKASRDVRRELGDDYLKFVATFRAQAIAYGAIVAAAERNDQTSLQKLVAQLDQLDRANDRRAEDLGFDDCASD